MYSNVQYLVFNFTPDSQCECEFLHRVFFFSFFKIILMLHLLTYEPNTHVFLHIEKWCCYIMCQEINKRKCKLDKEISFTLGGGSLSPTLSINFKIPWTGSLQLVEANGHAPLSPALFGGFCLLKGSFFLATVAKCLLIGEMLGFFK